MTPDGGRAPGPHAPRTLRQRRGERGEDAAAAYLQGLGWRLLARRVHVGRDEIDLLALEPGATPTLVLVEVRTRSTSRFGSPEESVDSAKVRRLYRAAAALRAAGRLPDGRELPRLPWRIDLVAVDEAPAIGPGAGGRAVRHLRALEPV